MSMSQSKVTVLTGNRLLFSSIYSICFRTSHQPLNISLCFVHFLSWKVYNSTSVSFNGLHWYLAYHLHMHGVPSSKTIHFTCTAVAISHVSGYHFLPESSLLHLFDLSPPLPARGYA
jgi:hypothetical protein